MKALSKITSAFTAAVAGNAGVWALRGLIGSGTLANILANCGNNPICRAGMDIGIDSMLEAGLGIATAYAFYKMTRTHEFQALVKAIKSPLAEGAHAIQNLMKPAAPFAAAAALFLPGGMHMNNQASLASAHIAPQVPSATLPLELRPRI